METFNFNFFGISDWDIDLNYCEGECLPWKWTEIILSHKGAKTSNKFPCSPSEGCPRWSLKGVRAGADFMGWPTLGGAMCLSHAHYPAFAPHT